MNGVDVQKLYRTATQAKINKLRRSELEAVWNVGAKLLAAKNREHKDSEVDKTVENDWYEAHEEEDGSDASLGGSNGYDSDEGEPTMPLSNKGLKNAIHAYVREFIFPLESC